MNTAHRFQHRRVAIGSALARPPCVIAAACYTSQSTHQRYRVCLLHRLDHFQERSSSLTKKAVDFLKLTLPFEFGYAGL
ncbi:hypothetical protein Y043_6358 [Burkholderia pseudomallei MSHR2138]|nr:hypothetical protein Y043_6358 [Burkholderia pseudomallei MSHR2138]